MEAKFTIPGRAIPKARPRVTRAGYAYTPRTTQQFEPPKSWPKQKREKAIQRKKYPTARPDLDNLWKAVADALNGIAYNDDSQIVVITCRKVYGEKFRSNVQIATLNY